MKNIWITTLLFLIGMSSIAQENIFHSTDFWNTNPSLEEVKQLIKEGNSPVALNKNAFDATVYAIIRGAQNDIIEYLLNMEGNSPNKKTHDGRNYLHWASYANNVAMVQELLVKGSSVSKKDSHGYTPLAFAANTGVKDIELYKLFSKHGVNLKKEQSEHGASLLLLVAASLQNEKELNDFLNLGLDLHSVDEDGNNIFHYAVKKGNIPFLKLLIQKGVNHKAINKNGGNAMLMASRGARGHQNTLELYTFLESHEIPVNIIGDQGRNPLHAIATNSKDIDIIDYFIERYVDVNLADIDGNTPFMNAASYNNLEVVKYLYKHVNQVNLKNKDGKTALMMAVYRNEPSAVQFLIDEHADLSPTDHKGNSLAYYLLKSYSDRNTDYFNAKLELLTHLGVSMSTIQEDGHTLYHIAVAQGSLNLLKQLEEFDIDLNLKNDDGLTALHLAAMTAKNESIIKYLISKGADIHIKTDFEESAYDLAKENELLNNTALNYLK